MSRVIHFEIHATEPDSLIAFYQGLFGWTFTRWGDAPYWLIGTGPRDQPGIDGGLMARMGGPPADGAAVNAYVCTVDVADVDDVVARATTAGGAVALPKMAVPGVGWLAYVKDPDGNLLGLMQSDPAAK